MSPTENKKVNKQNKNAGYSLVMVLISIGFVGMLVSVILYMSYINLSIRTANLKNRDSFYTAENALEEIHTGLEKKASDAFGYAYLSIIENYEVYSDSQRGDQFSYTYVNSLRDSLKYPSASTLYDLSLINSFLTDTAWNDAEGYGATVTTVAGATDYGTMVARTDGILLKDLKVTYKGEDGNVSIIETDILIKIPDISFQDSFQVPDIANYIVIANDEIDVNWGSSVLTGSVYAGPGGININRTSTDFSGIQTIITDGDITLDGTAIALRDNSTIWADGINVKSCSASLNGNAYIQDDLTISGSGCNVVISNGYYGYGYSDGDSPEDNSAIIVNATGTTLDMSGVNNLYLAGHSYIKTAGTVDFGSATYDNDNVMMGESLAIKSDQIAYLVPEECLWVKDGVSLCKANPVIFSKIADYQAQGATEVDLSVISKKLNVPVSNYASGYTKVYSNSGNVKVVNYYLTFASEEKANKFFKAFYEADKERLDKYLKVYVSSLKLPGDDAMKVSLAGNAFTMKDGKFELVSSTKSTDDNSKLKLESDEYAKAFTELCTTLSRVEPTAAEVTEKEKNGIFYNIVDRTMINKLVPNDGDKFTALDSEGQNGVLIINNTSFDYSMSTHSEDWNKIHILIATGDVTVDRSFKGVVVSGGKITISGSASLTPDPDAVAASMRVVADIDGAQYMIVNLFSDGNYVVMDDDTDNNETISIDKLITYENWSEK